MLRAFLVILFFSCNVFGEELVGFVLEKRPKPYVSEYYLYDPETKSEYLVKSKNVEHDFILIEAAVKKFQVKIEGKLKNKVLIDPVFSIEKIKKN